MSRNEAKTRFEFIEPSIFQKGWIRKYITVKKPSIGTFINDKGKVIHRRRRPDYLLCLLIKKNAKPRNFVSMNQGTVWERCGKTRNKNRIMENIVC
jgi:hypothetical protein